MISNQFVHSKLPAVVAGGNACFGKVRTHGICCLRGCAYRRILRPVFLAQSPWSDGISKAGCGAYRRFFVKLNGAFGGRNIGDFFRVAKTFFLNQYVGGSSSTFAIHKQRRMAASSAALAFVCLGGSHDVELPAYRSRKQGARIADRRVRCIAPAGFHQQSRQRRVCLRQSRCAAGTSAGESAPWRSGQARATRGQRRCAFCRIIHCWRHWHANHERQYRCLADRCAGRWLWTATLARWPDSRATARISSTPSAQFQVLHWRTGLTSEIAGKHVTQDDLPCGFSVADFLSTRRKRARCGRRWGSFRAESFGRAESARPVCLQRLRRWCRMPDAFDRADTMSWRARNSFRFCSRSASRMRVAGWFVWRFARLGGQLLVGQLSVFADLMVVPGISLDFDGFFDIGTGIVFYWCDNQPWRKFAFVCRGWSDAHVHVFAVCLFLAADRYGRIPVLGRRLPHQRFFACQLRQPTFHDHFEHLQYCCVLEFELGRRRALSMLPNSILYGFAVEAKR